MTRNKHSPNRLDRNPLPEEVRALRERYNLTQRDLAGLAFSSQRTVQSWEAPIGAEDHKRMHPAAWWLVRLRLGDAQLSDLIPVTRLWSDD